MIFSLIAEDTASPIENDMIQEEGLNYPEATTYNDRKIWAKANVKQARDSTILCQKKPSLHKNEKLWKHFLENRNTGKYDLNFFY